ncbi:hypothetical protein [Cellulomonas sp. IC4_254]|uniref:hypothetical protein n=1 Tax=Cellulomonas sp. IC4_254 TaxID=2714040 RepID=UPI0014249378|nr:hypothetical protein [Cellulomonas sp. IC4_254]NHT17442.1 hypothetical protein [Cellulomonas sp. IC4_254]
MTGVERRPDKGVPAECDRAAEQVRGICADLAGAASTASNLASTVRTAWQGQAGNAFCSSLDGATQSSRLTVAAWDRVKDELVRYATRLRDIQTRGDQIRSALSSAEDSLSTAKKTLARYQKDDDTAAWRITHARGTVDSLTHDIATQVVALDNLRAERQALDNATATALHTAPGAGAAAWQVIAYRNGRTVPRTDILDELLDLLDRDPTGNLDLLHQFLLMHSNDAELMGTFMQALGARRLLDLMRRADLMAGLDGGPVVPLLAAALATASQGWSTREQERFGAQLVLAIDADRPLLGTPHDSLRVNALLSATGLAPHVGLGAFKTLDALRIDDPRRFARIIQTENPVTVGLSDSSSSLCNTLFLLLAEIPSAARDYLLSSAPAGGAIGYWYGEHPWAGDGFAGPAALLHAVVTDPTLRPHDPTHLPWSESLRFLGGAVTALAGHPDLSISAVSHAASLHLAGAFARVAPEIAGLLTEKNELDDDRKLTTTALVDGVLTTITGLHLEKGPLIQVLGIVLQDPSALTLFVEKLQPYSTAAVGHATSGQTSEDRYLGAQGSAYLYALTHGALARQFEAAARAQTGDLQSAARALNLFISLIPLGSTGKAALDYTISVAAGSAPDLVVAVSGAFSLEEIEAISVAHRDSGSAQLTAHWQQALAASSFDTAARQELLSEITDSYDLLANAAANPNPSGSFHPTPAKMPDTCWPEVAQ